MLTALKGFTVAVKCVVVKGDVLKGTSEQVRKAAGCTKGLVV